MPTASFSEARRNLTQIADRVVNEGVEYTIFKRSKPLFKIVPAMQDVSPARPWTRQEAARRAQERAAETYGARGALAAGMGSAPEEPDAHGGLGPIPDGGAELFEYAMRLRERSSLKGALTMMTPADLKRELANRDA